jgi:hypothetical protein
MISSITLAVLIVLFDSNRGGNHTALDQKVSLSIREERQTSLLARRYVEWYLSVVPHMDSERNPPFLKVGFDAPVRVQSQALVRAGRLVCQVLNRPEHESQGVSLILLQGVASGNPHRLESLYRLLILTRDKDVRIALAVSTTNLHRKTWLISFLVDWLEIETDSEVKELVDALLEDALKRDF